MTEKITTRYDGDDLVFYEGEGAGRSTTGYDILRISPTEVRVGGSNNDVDFKIFLGSGTEYMLFDAGDSRMEFAADLVPAASDGAALGTTSLMWSDLMLASGAVVNFNAGDVTITHSTNTLTFAGASSGYGFDAQLNFTGTPTKVLAAGSYASMLTHQNSELITIAATDTTGWILGIGSYMRATGTDGKPFGICTLVESTGTTGTDRMQGIQAMAFLGTPGGSQAAHLKTLGGDATAGMYGAWFKVGANSNCVCDSGSRVAPLWVDNQMSGTVSGEEYAIFITCGASKVDAVFGFETTSSGWTYLFHFDETAYDQDPVSSLSCATDGSGSDGSLVFSLNGTPAYIPYFNTAT